MRSLDWVDRLVGLQTLQATYNPALECVVTPVGDWLEWPWWRRLLDLIRYWTIALVWALLWTTVYSVRYYRAIWMKTAEVVTLGIRDYFETVWSLQTYPLYFTLTEWEGSYV